MSENQSNKQTKKPINFMVRVFTEGDFDTRVGLAKEFIKELAQKEGAVLGAFHTDPFIIPSPVKVFYHLPEFDITTLTIPEADALAGIIEIVQDNLEFFDNPNAGELQLEVVRRKLAELVKTDEQRFGTYEIGVMAKGQHFRTAYDETTADNYFWKKTDYINNDLVLCVGCSPENEGKTIFFGANDRGILAHPKRVTDEGIEFVLV